MITSRVVFENVNVTHNKALRHAESFKKSQNPVQFNMHQV